MSRGAHARFTASNRRACVVASAALREDVCKVPPNPSSQIVDDATGRGHAQGRYNLEERRVGTGTFAERMTRAIVRACVAPTVVSNSSAMEFSSEDGDANAQSRCIHRAIARELPGTTYRVHVTYAD